MIELIRGDDGTIYQTCNPYARPAMQKALKVIAEIQGRKNYLDAEISPGRIKMCDSCEVLNINGINCHEQGCPDSWKDSLKECKWCGNMFTPEEKDQEFCGDNCAECYN